MCYEALRPNRLAPRCEKQKIIKEEKQGFKEVNKHLKLNQKYWVGPQGKTCFASVLPRVAREQVNVALCRNTPASCADVDGVEMVAGGRRVSGVAAQTDTH